MTCAYTIIIMQWLETDFLGYFEDGERSVETREGLSKTAKNKMLLSDATRSGIKLTGYCCMCSYLPLLSQLLVTHYINFIMQ